MTDSSVEKLERLLSYLDVDPHNINLLQDALELALEHQHQSTCHLAERLTLAESLSARGKFLLATWQLQQQHWQQAIEPLQQLLDDGYDHGAVRFNLALAHAFDGQMFQAHNILRPLFNEPQESIPEQTTLLYSRACHHTGDVEAAKLALHTLLQKTPTHNEALGLLALLSWDNGDTDSARSFAKKSLEYNPKNIDARLTLADLQLKAMDLPAAKTAFEQILQDNPSSGRAWRGFGLTALLQRDAVTAEAALIRSLETMSADVAGYQALAWAQALQQKSRQALESIDNAITLDPADDENHAVKACLLILNNQLHDADSTLSALDNADSDSVSVQCAKSLRYASQQQGKTSATLLETLLQKDSTVGKTYFELIQQFAQSSKHSRRSK